MAANDKQTFTGTWVIDLKRSESLEEVLKAQGVGLIKRKAINNSKITQKITIAADGSSMTLEFQSTFKTKTTTLKLDGSVEKDENDDGETVDRKASWKEENGETRLVVETTNPANKNQVTMSRRVIEGGNVLEQVITINKDGKETSAKRYFTKS